MTVLFYAAVHLVLAFLSRQRPYLARHGVNTLPRQHWQRVKLLDRHWKRIAQFYRTLEDKSREARYDCVTFTSADLIAAEQVVQDLRDEIKRTSHAGGVKRSV